VTDAARQVHHFERRGVEFLRTPATYYDMLANRLPVERDRLADR